MRRPPASIRSTLCALLGFALLPTSAVAAPGRPSGLIALPDSTTEIRLDWQDTADNETGFRVEIREGSAPFVFLGNLGANVEAALVSGLDPGTKYDFRIRSFNAGSSSTFSDVVAAFTDATTAPASFCLAGALGICLDDRFRIQGSWRTASSNGSATPVKLSDDSGALYFFSPDNLEMLVKVLNACPLNDRYWVFSAATTNVEYTLTVTDTQTGRIRRYFNRLNATAQAVTDTSAFATCP